MYVTPVKRYRNIVQRQNLVALSVELTNHVDCQRTVIEIHAADIDQLDVTNTGNGAVQIACMDIYERKENYAMKVKLMYDIEIIHEVLIDLVIKS